MSILFVHRVNGVINSAYQELQPGYAEEAVDSAVPELATYLSNTHMQTTDLSNFDNLDKVLKAVGLVVRDYTNALQAGTYTNKSIAQIKADFTAKYNSLP